MKNVIASKLSYLGAGVGLMLFAIFGLLYGSFIGGVLGLNIANTIFDSPFTDGLIPRVIVALGMLTGVMVSGLIFVLGSAALGWLIGFAIDLLAGKESAEEHDAIMKGRNNN